MSTWCSKHAEAWNKLIVKQKFCASSWLITKINILRCTVSKTSKFPKGMFVRLLSLVDVYNWFQEKYCLHLQGETEWHITAVTHHCNSCTSAQNSLFFLPYFTNYLPRGFILYRKMEVSNLSEKLLYIFQITRRHIPQDRNFYRPLGRPHLTFSFYCKSDENIPASLRYLIQNSEILCWKVFAKRVDFFTFYVEWGKHNQKAARVSVLRSSLWIPVTKGQQTRGVRNFACRHENKTWPQIHHVV